MPVYEYVCMQCEDHFDKLQRLSDADPPCPACGGERVRRQLSVFAAGASSTSSMGDVGGFRSGTGGCGCGGACSCGH